MPVVFCFYNFNLGILPYQTGKQIKVNDIKGDIIVNRELIIIIVSIGMVLFFYLIQDKSASPQPATLGDKSPSTAIIQDIVKQGDQTEERLKQTLEKAFSTNSDSL